MLKRANRYYNYEKPIRDGKIDPPNNRPRAREYSKEYFKDIDAENLESGDILNTSDRVWVVDGIKNITQVFIDDENTVSLKFKVDEETQTFSVHRNRAMPNNHNVLMPNTSNQRKTVRLFELMLRNQMQMIEGTNWVLNGKNYLENYTDDLFDLYEGRFRYRDLEDQYTEYKRLRDSFKTIFIGSNITEGCGLRISNINDDLLIESFDIEKPIPKYSAEQGIKFTQKMSIHWDILKLRYLQKSVERQNIDFILEVRYQMYPDAKHFGFDYKVIRGKNNDK